jgi:hypothetical protein
VVVFRENAGIIGIHSHKGDPRFSSPADSSAASSPAVSRLLSQEQKERARVLSQWLWQHRCGNQ